MSRGTWDIYYHNGVTWTQDGTIYRPNKDASLQTLSNATKIKLADGSNSFFIPETKYEKAPITFGWIFVTSTLVDKIVGYITNDNEIKITDHNAVEYIGKFISATPNWLVGEVDDDGEDLYDLDAIFEIIPSLA